MPILGLNLRMIRHPVGEPRERISTYLRAMDIARLDAGSSPA